MRKFTEIKKAAGLFLGVATLVMMSSAANAATATQNLDVSATVIPSCVFGNPATLPFGNLGISDLIDGKNETDPASVKITCTNTGVAAKLYATAARTMAGTGGTLNYVVYTDAARTIELGTTVGAGADVIGDGTEKTISLRGKISAGQPLVPAVAYTQALQMTVEF